MRWSRRDHDFFDAHGPHRRLNVRSVDAVAIPDDEPPWGVPRPRLTELLRGPRGRRMRRDVHVDDAASIVRQHDEHQQHAKRRGGDREEVDRGKSGEPEPAAMPAHNGVGCHDLDGPSPVRPDPREHYPQEAIGATETRAPRRLALEDGELMAKGENLRFEFETRPNGRPESGDQSDKQRGHAAVDRVSLGPHVLRAQEVPSF